MLNSRQNDYREKDAFFYGLNSNCVDLRYMCGTLLCFFVATSQSTVLLSLPPLMLPALRFIKVCVLQMCVNVLLSA